MDEGNRRSSPPRKAWESQDPLVQKYLRYRSVPETGEQPAPDSRSSAGMTTSDAGPSRVGAVFRDVEPKIVPDRGLRSRPFGEREGTSPAARPARGPHGIDPTWYAQRPWKSASARILPSLLILGAAWAVFSLVFGTNGVVRLWELKAREKILQARLEAVSKEHDELQRELQEPAPLALERSAREKFDLQRPGEIVYRFPRVPAETFAVPDARSAEGDAPHADTPEPAEGASPRGDSKSGN